MKMKRKPWSKVMVVLLMIAICFGAPLLQFPALEVQAASTTDGLEYTVNDDQTVTITGYNGSATELQIPADIDGYPVTSIGNYAFESRGSLTSIDIPTGVTSIGERAFSYCSRLTSIKLPDSLTSIGYGAFYHNSLVKIEIPNNVMSIGDYAFAFSDSVTSIKIPSSVTSIGDGAFESCACLAEINVEPENTVYTAVEGVLFNKEKTLLITCPGGKEGNYSIPNSASKIGNDAFSDCISLTSIEIPNSVTSIGEAAFAYCSSITSIELPFGITSIGEGTFTHCSSLRNIKLPTSITSIGESAFDSCSELTSIEIPKGVTSIEQTAFRGCTSLENIELPPLVTSIKYGTFYGCDSLISIEIPNSITSIETWVFYGCSSLTEINVDSENSEYASIAGVLMDKGLSTLITCPGGREGNYSIPNSVTNIRENAFAGCSKLKSVDIPDSVMSIGEGAFRYCVSLTDIKLPNSITSIEANVFGCCSSLTSIKIPNRVTSIADFALSNCDNLKNIIIPESVTSMGQYVFSFTNLDHVVFGGSEDAWKSLTVNSGLSVTVHCNATEDVLTKEASVQPDCFNNGYTTYKCSLCKKEYNLDLVLPTGHSFKNNICSNCGKKEEDCIESSHPYKNNTDNTWTIYRPEANEIRITFSSTTMLPNDMDTISIYDKDDNLIGEYHGKELASQQIRVKGDTVKIKLVSGDEVTAYGFSVSDIEVIMKDPTEPTPPDAFEIFGAEDQTASIDGYIGKETELIVPKEINGYTPTAISADAFKNSPVTSIVLPETVAKIGAGAFAGSSLKRITITANEIEIAEDAFDGCENVIICCYSASKAYAFAQAHGIAVELLDAKPTVVYGDLDGSGSIDANDALLILRIAAKLQTPTEEQRIAGDVDESNNVDANDALYVLKKAAKLIDVFPAEAK